jgi:hypothetical protein
VYLGYVIGGSELKIDHANMEAIMKCSIPTNCTKFRSFVGVAKYFQNFIDSFLAVVAPLHKITSGSKSFQWGKNQQKSFDEVKINIIQEPVLVQPNLQNPFEVEIDASGYTMGEVMMQGGRHGCYHSEVFHGSVLNYPTYSQDVYALIQYIKRWKHYLMGNETIIHTNHHLLQYLQTQINLQQTRHYKWMGFLQKFHLVIKYNKGITNNFSYMLSQPPTSKITGLGTLMMHKKRHT